jgi:hypothetical protein
MTFKCTFCQRTFSTRGACTQHINYCIPPASDSEESELVAGTNDMSLDSEDLVREVKNWQIIAFLKNIYINIPMLYSDEF